MEEAGKNEQANESTFIP